MKLENALWCLVASFSRRVQLASLFFLFLLLPLSADEITASFRRFGALVVDWPHKAESKSYFPPKGYAFLLFQVKKKSDFFCVFALSVLGISDDVCILPKGQERA